MTCPMLQKMNRKLHLSKVKHSKFNESGQLLVFYLASVIWGADIILRVSAACKTSIQNFLLAKSSSSNGPILKQSTVYCSAVCALRWFCRSHCSASAGLIMKQSAGFYSASDSIHVPYTTFAILGALPLQVWFWNSLQVIIPQATVCALHRFCHSRCSAFAGLILKQSTGCYSASDSMRLTPLLPFSVLCLCRSDSETVYRLLFRKRQYAPYTAFAILGALPLQVWFWNSLQVVIPQVTVCALHRFCHSRCSAFAGLILKQSTGYYSASDSMRLTPLLPFSVLCLCRSDSETVYRLLFRKRQYAPYTAFAILGALPLQVWFWNSLQVIIPQATVCALHRFCHSWCSASTFCARNT